MKGGRTAPLAAMACLYDGILAFCHIPPSAIDNLGSTNIAVEGSTPFLISIVELNLKQDFGFFQLSMDDFIVWIMLHLSTNILINISTILKKVLNEK